MKYTVLLIGALLFLGCNNEETQKEVVKKTTDKLAAAETQAAPKKIELKSSSPDSSQVISDSVSQDTANSTVDHAKKVSENAEIKTEAKPSEQAKVEAKEVAAPKGTLMFFINPNGRPCQMQDQILRSAGSQVTEKVNIRYVMTTNPNDRATFYEYGIRALPSLVVLGADGKEVHRFAPGIQDMPQLQTGLSKLK